MTTSTQFALPTGKPSSATVDAKKAIETAASISAPQTWATAVPAIQAAFLAKAERSPRTVRPMEVPAVLQRPAFTMARPMEVPAKSITPTIRPVMVVPSELPPPRPAIRVPPKPLMLAPERMNPSYNPMAVPAVMTTGAASCAPQAVLATTTPSWPAPSATPGLAITAPAATTLPITRTTADTVIGSSIFGGPITVGDPEVGLLHLSPYTEIEELPPAEGSTKAASPLVVRPAKAAKEPLDKGEGWKDVFGISHGYQVPKDRVVGMGRGAFNIQAPLSSYRGVGDVGTAAGSAVGMSAAIVVGGIIGLLLPFGLGYYMGKSKR